MYDLFEQLEDEILGQSGCSCTRLLFEDQLDFSHHMGFIVELAQRFNAYMPRLMAGDPSFEERLKEIIAPLLNRFILPEEGLSPRGQEALRAFSGLLGAVGASDPDSMPISRLIELIVGARYWAPTPVFGGATVTGGGCPACHGGGGAVAFVTLPFARDGGHGTGHLPAAIVLADGWMAGFCRLGEGRARKRAVYHRHPGVSQMPSGCLLGRAGTRKTT